MSDKCLIIIFCLIFFQGKGQVWDDFSDGELHQSPEWSGDTGSFRVTQDYWLQLNAAAAGKASLFTDFNPGDLGDLTRLEWGLTLRLTFSPSANNLIRWYLWRSVPEAGLPGYEAIYIQVGENGSEDGIDLFYETNAGSVKWIDGASGTMTASENSADIRVFYTATGDWELYASTGMSEWMQLQGSTHQVRQLTTGYTGLSCVFTSGNLTRFYFDSYYAGPVRTDTIPPKVLYFKYLLPGSMDIFFSEVMDSIGLQSSGSFEGIPMLSLEYNNALPSQIRIRFAEDIEANQSYQLRLSSLQDTAHNQLVDTVLSFLWHPPEIFDVLITEIMADPSPPVALPEAEYLELFNAGDYPLSLEKWNISIGSRLIHLPDYQLLSKQYVLLCTDGYCPQFGPFVNCLDLLSSSSLPNTGSAYLLKDSGDVVIDFGAYYPEWHSGMYQSDGGYSLEMLDINNPCGESDNWGSSRHETGGTPGAANSVACENPDLQVPAIQRVYWIDSLTAGIFFDESIMLPLDHYPGAKSGNMPADTDTPDLLLQLPGDVEKVLNNSMAYRLLDGESGGLVITIDGNPISGYRIVDWQQKHLHVQSANVLEEAKMHRLGVSFLTDCAGNYRADQSQDFQKPSRASPGELVINEVLFNPAVDGVDYIELYNVSDKVFDISELLISGIDLEGQPEEVKNLADFPYPIFPKSYVVLTSDPAKVMAQYPTHAAAAFMQDGVSLPGMANDSGEVALLDKTMLILDQVRYSEGLHYGLLRSFEGVALEKVSPDLPGFEASSWFSAAEDVGFGTPGLANSQLREKVEDIDMFSLDYPSFSPNMDGYHDLLVVNYALPEAGYIADIQIFNEAGLRVRVLSEERFLSMQGQICWDGLDDSGLDLPVGLYFVVVRYYHPTGRAGRERLDCALVRAGG